MHGASEKGGPASACQAWRERKPALPALVSPRPPHLEKLGGNDVERLQHVAVLAFVAPCHVPGVMDNLLARGKKLVEVVEGLAEEEWHGGVS